FTLGADASSLCWSSDPYHHLPCWIWIGFGGKRRINRVVLYAGEMHLQPVEFYGQVSDDAGATIKDVFQVNNARFDPATLSYAVDFEPVDTDNFRLLITRSAAPETPQSHWAQLSEMEVYGDNAPAVKSLGLPAGVAPMAAGTVSMAAVPASSLKPDASFSPRLHDDGRTLDIRTLWYRIQLDKTRPRIAYLSWDSLGEGNVNVNFLRGLGGYPRLERILHGAETAGAAPLKRKGNVFQYAPVPVAPGVALRLALKAGERDFDLELTVLADRETAMQGGVFRFDFAPNQTPTTFVCHPATIFNYVPTPCYLHAPDWGTAFITCGKADTCFYRSPAGMFPALDYHIEIAPQIPTRPDRRCTYGAGTWQETLHFNVETIRPLAELTRSDARLHRLPAYALNITQWRPDTGIISNSVASINCGLSMLFYAEMAAFSPPLKAGISAMELVRASLHRYFNGVPGYLMPPRNVYAARGDWRSSRETAAYLIICAWYVIRTIGGMEELDKSLYALECIAGDIESWSTNGLAYQGKVQGFNHGFSMWFDCYIIRGADAYSNAANYRAFRCLAELENLAGRQAMAEHYHQNADRIQDMYMKAFFNPATGVLAGWRDDKGWLHDYMFPWVNGFAIYQGLVPDHQANAILDRLLAQIKKDGFKSWQFGLPTNLIPIHPSDYIPNVAGSPKNPSGTDSWQQYMNGGACPNFVYYVIQSFYNLGRRNDAEKLLWPLVESFSKGIFNAGYNGDAPKWPQRNPVGSAFYLWNGSHALGEGYLPENWQAMAAIFTGHYGIRLDDTGYRLEPWSPLKGRKIKLGLPFMGTIVETVE
ncbi:MAG: glucosidase family protein, partial [Phycisphaerae bacterium]